MIGSYDAMSLENGLACGNTKDLILAILELRRRWGDTGEAGVRPNAYLWEVHTSWRADLVTHIAGVWAQQSGIAPQFFPWKDDYVIGHWVGTRKQKYTKEKLADALQSIDFRSMDSRDEAPTLPFEDEDAA